MCLVFVCFNNPVGAITGKVKKQQKTTATATATPTHHSFSGDVGGAVVGTRQKGEREDDTLCYTKFFINRGVPHVVLNNGKTARLDGGRKYHECE